MQRFGNILHHLHRYEHYLLALDGQKLPEPLIPILKDVTPIPALVEILDTLLDPPSIDLLSAHCYWMIQCAIPHPKRIPSMYNPTCTTTAPIALYRSAGGRVFKTARKLSSCSLIFFFLSAFATFHPVGTVSPNCTHPSNDTTM